ncbi:MAG: GspE/PulE family protein [Patescibacteria group bacterium]|nr:GspE/PulE family protein [Patescibacteria group bacterium]
MMIDYNNKVFAKIKELGILDDDKMNFIIEKLQEKSDTNIDKIIKQYYIIDQEEYAKIKSEIINVPYKNLVDEEIEKEILKTLPQNLSENYKMIVFAKDNNVLSVGMVDPENFSAIEAMEFLAHKNNYNIKYFIISEASFNSAYHKIEDIKEEVGEVLDYAKEKFEDINLDEDALETQELGEVIRTAPVTKIVSVIIKHAVDGRASDIHIEPVGRKSVVRFRIDGKLHNSIILPIYIHNALITRVKVMANMKIDETRIPQDGRIRIKVKRSKEEKRIDFRVSTLPLIDYEKVVMRILSTPDSVPQFEDLGFIGLSKKVVEEGIQKSHGMFLVTGPTGSGKSFTLFTALNKVNAENINISTLEDPVEYNIERVNQSQIKPEVGFTFASGLRSLLRQDPDVVMVGEIRDNETAELAVHAALTGHLVLSTLHTNNALGAIPRLMDMKIEPFLLASTLNLVIAQRLVRKICENCIYEIKAPQTMIDKVNPILESLPETAFYGKFKKGDGLKFYEGKGCNRCGGTGYKGRIAIVEVILLDKKLKDIISNGANIADFNKAMKESGYINMMQDGIIKAMNGITTVEEVISVTNEE